MSNKKHKIGKNVFEVGKSYYSAFYHEACEEDDEPARVSIDEHVLRSVRKKYYNCSYRLRKIELGQYAHFTLKIKYVTWIKLSKKQYHWGFANNIPQWCVKKYLISDDESCDLTPSVKGALRKEIARVKKCKRSTEEYKKEAVKKLTQRLKRIK